LDNLFDSSKHTLSLKLFVFIDVWLKSFLFRATFIGDVVFCLALLNEIWLRQETMNQMVALYAEKLKERKIEISSEIIRKFRSTHRNLLNLTHQWDSIYGPGMILYFSFFLLYLLADINNFVMNGRKGKKKGRKSFRLILIKFML
jgi:hypothetical protein